MNSIRIKIGLITLFIIAVAIGILFITKAIISFDNNFEFVKLQNNINGENIYLLKVSWGNDSRMAIGLDKKLNAGFGYNHPDKYEDTFSEEMFFYKLNQDTLYIFGANFKKPEINKFKTKIKVIPLENYERIHIGENKNYERMGLNVFPPKERERLNYVDSLNK